VVGAKQQTAPATKAKVISITVRPENIFFILSSPFG
jgi:hypothetical protein